MNDIVLPSLDLRSLSTGQYVNGVERIGKVVLDEAGGLPASQTLLRQVATKAVTEGEALLLRLGLDRKRKLAAQKQRLHRSRRLCLTSLRDGARQLLRSPDPLIAGATRDAAAKVAGVFGKHKDSLRLRSQADTSTAVKLVLQDLETEEMQAALQLTELQRLHGLLQSSQADFSAIVLREDRADDEDGPTEKVPVQPESAARELAAKWLVKDIKASLALNLELLFRGMAFLAREGDEHSAELLAQCNEIAQKMESAVKRRETHVKKAAAKQAASAANTSPSRAKETPPRPATGAGSTSPEGAVNGGLAS